MRRSPPALIAAAVCAVVAGCGGDEKPDEPVRAAPASAAVEALRDSGHILVLRHAATDTGADMTDDLSDCSRQRNLSVAGREQARAIGRAVLRSSIPVGEVLASPFCRTLDTARLAFGRADASRRLLSPEFFADRRRFRRRGLPHLLRQPPQAGRNTVLVSHGTAIEAATGIEPEEGDAVVVEPDGERAFEVVGTIRVTEWERLAAAPR